MKRTKITKIDKIKISRREKSFIFDKYLKITYDSNER